MIAVIPLLFAIVAALVYALSNHGKVQALALHVFLGAWVALMFSLASKTVRILAQ